MGLLSDALFIGGNMVGTSVNKQGSNFRLYTSSSTCSGGYESIDERHVAWVGSTMYFVRADDTVGAIQFSTP